jgi:tRNA(fMet)-specific endonuclease VapC
MTYLLDTNTVSYFVRRAYVGLVQRILDSPPHHLAISVVSLGEFHYGLEKLGTSRRAQLLRKHLDELLLAVRVHPLPPEAAHHYGLTRTKLEAAGTPIGGNDLWIASHALAADMTLVTHNVGEFKRVPGLKIENWTAL